MIRAIDPVQPSALPALLFLVCLPAFLALRRASTTWFFVTTGGILLVLVAGPFLAGALLVAILLGYLMVEGAARLRGDRRVVLIGLWTLWHAAYWSCFHLPLPPAFEQADLRAADRPGVFVFFSGIALTFLRLLSYMHERLRLNAARLRLADYLAYMLFFPQFRHGPIERAHRFAVRLREAGQNWTFADLWRGLTRIGAGLLTLAAGVGLVLTTARWLPDSAPRGFLHAWEHPETLTLAQLLLVIHVPPLLLYALESGFASLQLGVSRAFGVTGTENFRYPFLASNPGEFWRRWNITLSGWLRDYAYIPLGGKLRRKYLNILLVFVYCGLLHGWQWRFLIWGLWTGGTMAAYVWLADRLSAGRPRKKTSVRHRRLLTVGRFCGRLLTVHWFCLGATIVFDPESCGYRLLKHYALTLLNVLTG